MKILFLEIETGQSQALASIGSAFIAAYVRRHGHDAALLRVKPDDEIRDLCRAIDDIAPGMIGFSMTTRQFAKASAVAEEIKERLDIPIIAGGLHPTFAPLSVLESGAFDYLCLGEGEEAVCELLTHLESGRGIPAAGISNIWLKGSMRPEIRPPAAVDDLPFMARDLLEENHGVVHISTMRGCPFPCAYCAGGAIGRLYGGRAYIRRRSVDGVLEELRQLWRNAPVNYVIFLDDTFTLDRNWLKEFCRTYGQEFGTGFSINARADTVNPEILSMLKKAGCMHVIYGVESGSRRVREDILNRPGDSGLFIDAVRWTKEAGMLATTNYMIGIPGETAKDIEETLVLNEKLAPDDFGCFVFYPYPGTVLFEVCRENGYLPEHYLDLPAADGHSILTLPGLTKDEISHYYNVFGRVRESSYLKKYGASFNEADQTLAVERLRCGTDAP